MAKFEKRVIVIASVLKAVDDVRMTAKIAHSLVKVHSFEIHCIGPGHLATVDPSVTLHPLGKAKRLSIGRLKMPWRVLKRTLKLKPELIIITSHELLLVAWIAKVLSGCKIVYDIQENYFRNILFSNAFPYPIRPFLSLYVRLKEILVSPFIDHFFLAEKVYKDEMKFLPDRFTILENKSLSLPVIDQVKEKLHFVFTGTLAESTGVFIAIDIVSKFFKINPEVTLTIIGTAHQDETRKKLKDASHQHSFIKLITEKEPIPYKMIVDEILRSDVGIISYPSNIVTRNRIPTKLFEYISCKLPILLVNNPVWVSKAAEYQAAVVINPTRFDAIDVLSKLNQKHFYHNDKKDVLWISEEPKLISVVNYLLN